MKTLLQLLLMGIITIIIPVESHSQWISANTGTSEDLTTIASSESGYLVCGGTNGIVLISNDQGETWNSVFVGFETITHIDACQNLCFAVTDNGYVYRSDAGGQSWQLLQYLDLKLRALCIQSPEKVYTAGRYESVYESHDLGLSWQLIPNITGANVWFRDITFHDKQNGYIVGDYGRAYKTPNFGYGWFLMNTGSVENLYGVSAPSEDTAYICGLNGTIIKTIDGGINWESVYSGQENFISICFLSSQDGYASSAEGIILHTMNGGETWDLEMTMTATPLQEFCFVKDINRLLVCGNEGIIMYKDLETGYKIQNPTTEPISSIQVLTNPVKEKVLFRIEGLENKSNKLVIFSSQAKEIVTFENITNGDIEVNLSPFPSGTYFYKLAEEKTILSAGKFVKN